MSNWKTALFLPKKYICVDGIWLNKSIAINPEINVFNSINFVSRVAQKYTTLGQETPIYMRHFDYMLKNFAEKDLKFVMDLGCGDGRFIPYLLEKGFEHVVAVDISLDNLERIQNRLSEKEKNKVLLVCDDIYTLSFNPYLFDWIFAIGLLHLLKDIPSALNIIGRLLKRGGHFVNGEATFDQALLYSLVIGDIEEFIRVAKTATRGKSAENLKERYAILKCGQIEKLLEQEGFRIQQTYGISMYPSLVFGGFLQKHEVSEEKKEELSSVLNSLCSTDTTAYRVILYLSQKNHATLKN